jgi:hypothetical protein
VESISLTEGKDETFVFLTDGESCGINGAGLRRIVESGSVRRIPNVV